MKTKKERNALKEKEVETESKEPRKLTEEELAQVTGGGGGSNRPCMVIGPYWGNAMRTDGPYYDLCYQSGVTAEYAATPDPNCKFRLWRGGQSVGWTDESSLQM